MKKLTLILLIGLTMFACNKPETNNAQTEFKFAVDRFADLNIGRYQVPGFENLTPKQKELVYYLYEAALSGRDIFTDQNYKYNLTVRKTLENIVSTYKGDRNSDDFKKFMIYAKRVWYSNGIHHHYSRYKILPDISSDYFNELVKNSDAATFPVNANETVDQFLARVTPIIFDPNVAPLKVNQDPKKDLVTNSAVNFYEGVNQKEVEDYYKKLINPKDQTPISYGLNSKMVKENGKLVEKTWKVGGMYGAALEKMVYWLKKAEGVAETDIQGKALGKLAEYLTTGDLKTFDDYNILWVQDTASTVDVTLGFIENYEDPLGYRATYESVVSIKDFEATKRIKAIGDQAQWFEDNSPIADQHKKKSVVGISGKVITVVVEAGDAAPTTPIGINLPNANWIRQKHGSKSVSLGNIVHAYSEIGKGNGVLEEFAYSPEEIDIAKKYGSIAGDLHTDMHEVIGHASGQINAGVGTPKETLKNYASALEEARADLVGLYYIMDQKLVDIGVSPSLDVAKAEYNGYIRNGLMVQLARLKMGETIEEAHMRNRQMVAKWAYENGKKDNVIEKIVKDGKTYFVINDYAKLRALFGQLLRETQRIVSEGDYASCQALFETYGIQVDPEIHKEVLDRYAKLNVAPYTGFIQPRLVPVMNGDQVSDVKIEYPDNFVDQMLEYGKNYGFLPVVN